MRNLLIFLAIAVTICSATPKIKFGFDKRPFVIDFIDYKWNHEAIYPYHWCKFKLTIYF